MNAGTHSDGGLAFTIAFSADDLASISGNGHTGKANMRQVRLVAGRKLMEIILPAYHGIAEDEMGQALRHVEVGKVRLRTSKRKHGVLLLEIIYRFPKSEEREGYRRVFRFVSKNGGLAGKLYPRKTRPPRSRDNPR